MTPSWSEPLGLHELAHGPVRRRLIAGEEARRRIAKDLDLDSLDVLEADVEVTPWLDGVEVRGTWRAAVAQTCGVTLEPLLSEPEGSFSVRALPAGSANLPEEPAGEVAVDLEVDDPPDVFEDGKVDLAAYVVEHLALEIDPFPRKPGAVFTPPDEPQETSPFAVLREFKPKRDDG
jgi:uncharacterized metal-binding protein YceD (DUF177 family)